MRVITRSGVSGINGFSSKCGLSRAVFASLLVLLFRAAEAPVFRKVRKVRQRPAAEAAGVRCATLSQGLAWNAFPVVVWPSQLQTGPLRRVAVSRACFCVRACGVLPPKFSSTLELPALNRCCRLAGSRSAPASSTFSPARTRDGLGSGRASARAWRNRGGLSWGPRRRRDGSARRRVVSGLGQGRAGLGAQAAGARRVPLRRGCGRFAVAPSGV